MMSEFEVIETPAGPARLKRTHRRTLAISVLPDGSLELTAPAGSPETAILQKVEKRLPWIRAQRRHFSTMNAVRPALRYANGATHRYLGRQYRLKFSQGKEIRVALRGGYIHVQLPEISDPAVKKALTAWFRRLAAEQFQKRIAGWAVWCRQRKLPVPQFRLRTMPKRWGSALPNGTIYLNPELIHAPSACVDYVITHEICHLKYPDHGRKFWSLLRQLMPDWQTLKARLERAEG